MKVICIDGVKRGTKCFDFENKPTSTSIQDSEEIYEGETYIVVREWEHGGTLWYKLEGKPENMNYKSTRFAPISSIDETEMQRDYSTIKTLTP